MGRIDMEYFDDEDQECHPRVARYYGDAFQELLAKYIPQEAITAVLVEKSDMERMKEQLTDDDRRALFDAAEAAGRDRRIQMAPEEVATMADRFETECRALRDSPFSHDDSSVYRHTGVGRREVAINRFSTFETHVVFHEERMHDERGNYVWDKYVVDEYRGTDSGYGLLTKLSLVLDRAGMKYIEAGEYDKFRALYVATGRTIHAMQEQCRAHAKLLHMNKDDIDGFGIAEAFPQPERVYLQEQEQPREPGFSLTKQRREDFDTMFAKIPDKELRSNTVIRSDGITAVMGEKKYIAMLQHELGGEAWANGYKWAGDCSPAAVEKCIADCKEAEDMLIAAAKEDVLSGTTGSRTAYLEAKALHDEMFLCADPDRGGVRDGPER